MVKVAVVGVNHIGNTHCAVYQNSARATLVAVCDLVPERAHMAGQKYGVAAYTDLAQLLAEQAVDIVSIATSGPEGGGHHFAPAMLAIAAGKDVLVEKPLSNNLSEAREMVQAAKERGVRLACDLNHRFSPVADRARALVDEGRLGDLLFVNMRLTIANPNESSEWLHMRALHTHSLDVVRYLAGDIRRVQAFMTKAPGRQIWSTVSVNLAFASGAVGHLTGSYDMSMRHPIECCEVAGTRGRLVIDNVYERVTFYPHDSDVVETMANPIFGGLGSFEDTFVQRLDHFVGQVADGVAPAQIVGSGAEALAAQEVVEAAIRSHLAGGMPVDVPAP